MTFFEQFAAIFYNFILYGTLMVAVLPLAYFFLWIFFIFWQKHIRIFYFGACVLFCGTLLVFYFTRNYWMNWYYEFPVGVQIVGLLFIVFSYVILKLAQSSITTRVRFFYPLLKGERFHLKTTGIYKYLRHPIYAIFPLAFLGALLYTGQLIIFPIFLFNLLARTWYARREEKHLKKIVIGDYDKYMTQTPNRFYPKFF